MEYLTNSLTLDTKFFREHYGLEVFGSLEPGTKQGSIIIRSLEDIYVLKPVWSSSLKHLLYENEFSTYLSASGLPAQRIIPNCRSGLFTKYANQIYVLKNFFIGQVDTSDTNPSSNKIIQSAYTLSQIHKISQGYQGIKRHRHLFASSRVKHHLSNVFVSLSTKPESEEFDEIACEVAKIKLIGVNNQPFEVQPFMDLPYIMNHGDYHAANLVFDSIEQVIGILDFEYCTAMPRLWDLAWALHWFSRTRNTEAFTGEINLSKLHIFLKTYHQHHPLSETEHHWLASLMVSASYHSCYALIGYCREGSEFFSKRNLVPCTSEKEWLWYSYHKSDLREVIQAACA